MNNDFLKGSVHALAYYATGAALALIARLFFEDIYTLERGSKFYQQIITLTWLGGCLWALYALFKWMRGTRKRYYAGVAVVNLLVIGLVFIWVYQLPSPIEESKLPHQHHIVMKAGSSLKATNTKAG